MWSFGEVVVLRYRSLDGTYRFGFPLRVVADDGRRVVCHLRRGTEISAAALADGRDLRSVPLEERWAHPRTTVRRTWSGPT